MSINTPWQFIEEYYPNYSQSEHIAYIDDMTKIISMDNEDGDHSDGLFKLMYGGDYNNPQIMADYNDALVTAYESAIYNYIQVNKAIDQVNKIIGK